MTTREVLTAAPSTQASVAPVPSAPPAPPVFGPRIVIGLLGMLLTSLAAGLNEHVTDVAMTDVRGALFIGHDEGTWLTALFEATNVSAMAFAPWCAVTFSLRRFTIAAALAFALLGLLCPLAPNVETLACLRALQGLAGGCLPPMLMTAALRYLPANIKLYGLAGYALTATFGPNLGTPLAALWTEYVDWRMVFWQVVPMCLVSTAAIAYGLPQDPLRLERFRSFNWVGLLAGFPAISMLVIGLYQGDRLDWFNSPLICVMLGGGGLLFGLFLLNEWSHPLPFFQLRMLARRNFTHSLVTIVGVLVVLLGAAVIPSEYLAEVWGYRPLQIAPLSLVVALPQLVALPVVAAILNIERVDCRWVMALGLTLVGAACALGSFMTSDWVRENFYLLQGLLTLGEPMAVIAILLQTTTNLPPTDGPFASAMFNMMKGFAAAVGTGLVEALGTAREHYHSETLVARLGSEPQTIGQTPDRAATLADLAGRIHEQAVVLTSADLYLVMAAITGALVLLIPIVPVRVRPPRASAPTR
jgi:MFS transporter, DHA2 family, multidrug resistance protein